MEVLPYVGGIEPGVGHCHYRRVLHEQLQPSQPDKLSDIGQNTEAVSLMPTVCVRGSLLVSKGGRNERCYLIPARE